MDVAGIADGSSDGDLSICSFAGNGSAGSGRDFVAAHIGFDHGQAADDMLHGAMHGLK